MWCGLINTSKTDLKWFLNNFDIKNFPKFPKNLEKVEDLSKNKINHFNPW